MSDYSLFKYNVLFEHDEINPSDVLSCMNLDSSVVLQDYTLYDNTLWCQDIPPHNGNLLLEDESLL